VFWQVQVVTKQNNQYWRFGHFGHFGDFRGRIDASFADETTDFAGVVGVENFLLNLF